jgi:SAM-dependent methyltransferase
MERGLGFLDVRLVAIEQRQAITEPWSICAKRHSVEENRRWWDQYDWSQRGEEWSTGGEAWKNQVVEGFMLPYLRQEGVFVEVGPGGGRWTEYLQPRAKRLYLVDISERAMEICRDRFACCTNVEFAVNDGRTLLIPSASVDAVWSYDVFVHINPPDTRAYLQEFARVLKPGGYAMIHHPGGTDRRATPRRCGWRSDMTDELMWRFAREAHLEVVDRTQKYVNPGEWLSVFRQPGPAT